MNDNPPIDELKAIAHPLRFQIIQILKAGELNVGEIEQASGIGQPALSQQLGILRKADLVETRKSAKLVFYSLNTDRLRAIGTLVGGQDVSGIKKPITRPTSSSVVANFARLS